MNDQEAIYALLISIVIVMIPSVISLVLSGCSALYCVVSRWFANWGTVRAIRVVSASEKEFDASGKLVLGSDGKLRIHVATSEGTMRVSLAEIDPVGVSIMREQVAQNAGGKRESMLKHSRTVKCPFPKHTAIFRTEDGQIVGMGVRTEIAGKGGILTAHHVLKDLSVYPDVTIGSETQEVPLQSDWVVGLASAGLDLAFLEVPDSVLSGLGLRKASLASKIIPGNAVTVNWMQYGVPVMTRGAVSATKGLFFQHTASTDAGCSGAPVMVGNLVVGIHQMGYDKFNAGISLAFLLGKRESDVRSSAVHDAELSEWDFESRVRVGTQTTVMRQIGRSYDGRSFEAMKKAKGQLLWADMVDDDDVDYVDPWTKGVFESAYVPPHKRGKKESAVPAPKKVAPQKSLNENVRVRDEVPTTQSTSITERISRLEAMICELSKSARVLSSADRQPKGATVFRQKSTANSQNSKTGGGQKQELKGSDSLSNGMPVTTGAGPSQARTTKNEPSQPSSTPSQKEQSRPGPLPALIRRRLIAVGLTCCKKRKWITPADLAILKEKGTKPEILLVAEKFVRPAVTKPSTKL